MSRSHIHARLAPISMAALALLTYGSDVLARMAQDQIGFVDAGLAALRQPPTNLLAMALLALPIIGAELLAVEFARATTIAKGVLLLVVTVMVFWVMYFLGYLEYRESIAHSQWTRATLAIGLLPLKGAAVLIIPLVITAVAQKRRNKHLA